MSLIFDVDGIILDFTGPFAKYHNERSKIQVSENPTTWNMGFLPSEDTTELYKLIDDFHIVHDNLPLIEENIPNILKQLQEKYNIILVTAYPDREKRISNLEYHNVPYDELICNATDKVECIKNHNVVAIFEDGPHHINKYLPNYSGKIYVPNFWNYTKDINKEGIQFYSNSKQWLNLL